MSRHEGVSCDVCLKANFRGRRYKCLICYDYDLCSSCFEGGATTSRHSTEHPMQCILTRHDFDIFHGGEALTGEQPQSLTCPLCGKMGFTEATLKEHVTANHPDVAFEVVCPICASVPGGDPNYVTNDFAAHLTLDHRSGAPREIDDSGSSSRHGVRRMPHQGRGLNRGVRRNMTFGSVSGGFFSPSSRDSMDPIAELLSQLSGVRRATAGDLSTSGTSAAQLSSQLDQVAARHQQLERIPRRGGSTSLGAAGSGSTVLNASNSSASAGSTAVTSTTTNITSSGGSSILQNGAVVSLGSTSSTTVTTSQHQNPPPVLVSTTPRLQGQSNFLLSRLSEMDTETESSSEGRDRAAFLQELLLSTLSELSLGLGLISEITESGSISDTSIVEKSPAVNPPSSTPVLQPSIDASTQTSPTSLQNPYVVLGVSNTSPLVPQKGNHMNVPTHIKSTKGLAKAQVLTRSSPSGSPVGHQSQSSGGGGPLGSNRVLGTGTVSIPPLGLGRGGRTASGAVSPGSNRRKLIRGIEGRTTQPPAPH